MAPYEQETDDHAAALRLYEWNKAVSAAFFEDLGAFEVLLRNAIDLKLRAKYQATASAPPWYQSVPLSDKAKEKVTEAIDSVARRGPVDQDKVVAELSFGFWRYLLGARYQASLWPVLQSAFVSPVKGRRIARLDVEPRVDSLHYVRNRVAHHEPIFVRDLADDHRQLVSVAGWICPDTQVWIMGGSRVRELLAQRPTK
jgi:hypothetical protein